MTPLWLAVPLSQVLKLPAYEFNHMDFDCNGSLNRDEFYFFFYGWLANKIPVEEVRQPGVCFGRCDMAMH